MQTSKTPPVAGGASRDQLGRWSQSLPILGGYQAQFLIAEHHIRPEVAAMVAALAFNGGAQ
ncbi:hypothetical protein [Altericroceibacterium xinjiangense]|uniref:hypothetical protein n=1 Tax=Altericroceibacterium xinjiangense TaxID=762261 RepID=UPI000F7DEF13|nr:hypothetical protein [Altericroceibacterium xinjiangense]